MWTDEHTQGGCSLHAAVSQLGTVLQGAVHHLFDTWGAGASHPLHDKEKDQDWSEVHQMDPKRLEQEGQMVDNWTATLTWVYYCTYTWMMYILFWGDQRRGVNIEDL